MEIQRIVISERDRQLISVFMGEDYPTNIDFNWLMPVVEKVTSLTKEKRYIPPGKYLEYKEQRDKYDEQWEKLFDYQAYNFFSGEIKSIYQAIVEFIKWYNSNKDNNG